MLVGSKHQLYGVQSRDVGGTGLETTRLKKNSQGLLNAVSVLCVVMGTVVWYTSQKTSFFVFVVGTLYWNWEMVEREMC